VLPDETIAVPASTSARTGTAVQPKIRPGSSPPPAAHWSRAFSPEGRWAPKSSSATCDRRKSAAVRAR